MLLAASAIIGIIGISCVLGGLRTKLVDMGHGEADHGTDYRIGTLTMRVGYALLGVAAVVALVGLLVRVLA